MDTCRGVEGSLGDAWVQVSGMGQKVSPCIAWSYRPPTANHLCSGPRFLEKIRVPTNRGFRKDPIYNDPVYSDSKGGPAIFGTPAKSCISPSFPRWVSVNVSLRCHSNDVSRFTNS